MKLKLKRADTDGFQKAYIKSRYVGEVRKEQRLFSLGKGKRFKATYIYFYNIYGDEVVKLETMSAMRKFLITPRRNLITGKVK